MVTNTEKTISTPPRIGVTTHLPDDLLNGTLNFPVENSNTQQELRSDLTVKPESIEEVFLKLHFAGVTDIRFDVRMQNALGENREKYLGYVGKISQISEKMGLKNMVVLSADAKFTKELLKEPEDFLEVYKNYVTTVRNAFGDSNNISSIQIFNEVNNIVYTAPELLSHMKECMGIVREVFGREVPLTVNLIAGYPSENIPSLNVDNFVKKYSKDFLSEVDEIKVDYYPGLWHFDKRTVGKLIFSKNSGKYLFNYVAKALFNRPLSEKLPPAPTEDFVDMFSDTKRLKDIFKTINDEVITPAKNGESHKAIGLGIGEFGYPTFVGLDNNPEINNDQFQKLGIGIQARSIGQVIQEMDTKLSSIGLYQLYDEKPPELGRLNWGIFDNDFNPKRIVRNLDNAIHYLTKP